MNPFKSGHYRARDLFLSGLLVRMRETLGLTPSGNEVRVGSSVLHCMPGLCSVSAFIFSPGVFFMLWDLWLARFYFSAQ